MSKNIGSSLLKLANDLQKVADRLRELAESETQEKRPVVSRQSIKKKSLQAPPTETIDRFRSLPRSEVETELNSMTHTDIEPIFAALTSMSGKKKPKEMMVSKILFHLFDFSAGHEVARNRPSENK
jgi:hypothetical protein